MKARTRQGELHQLLSFHSCALCSYELSTREGERACNYGDCPYLPEAMDTRCPTCLYNFYTDDLRPACGNPPTCEFARTEAPPARRGAGPLAGAPAAGPAGEGGTPAP